MSSFYYCRCFISHNIYIKEYNTHFKYIDSTQFRRDYEKILPSLGCNTEVKKSLLLEKIIEEVRRRKNLEEQALKRKNILKTFYKPLDVSVYTLQENFLDPYFIMLVKVAEELNIQKILPLLDTISVDKQLYGFPVFTENFCSQLLRELHHYEESSMPKGRPNSMNRYGVLLDELGFHDSFTCTLRTKYLDPLAAVLFPVWRQKGLDSHKVFTVGYRIGKDLDLGYHYDNSEITLNVCLNNSFEGGDLFFGDIRTVSTFESSCISVPHKLGYGIFHRGQQLHGALPIVSGERCNLILWMRSSSVRNKMCPMCNSKPMELIPSTGYGDGFTSEFTAQTSNVI